MKVFFLKRFPIYGINLQLFHFYYALIFSEARGLLGHLQELPKRSCDTGDMRQLVLYSNGKVDDKGCGLLPQTCAVIGSIFAATSYKSGQVGASYYCVVCRYVT